MLKKLLNRDDNLNDNRYSDPANERRGPQGSVASVVELVPVLHLFGNMLVLKDGSFRMIVRTGAVNFDLKSHREQMVLLNTFGELLNSLSIDFPIQVFLHSAHLDTEAYIARYGRRLRDPGLHPKMRRVIQNHLEFFEYQTRANHLLDRSFYVVVPYYPHHGGRPADGGIGSDMPLGGLIKSLLDTSAADKAKLPPRRDMEVARTQLLNRCGLMIAQLSRLTISAEILDELQLVSLLRELYNPGISERQKIRSLDEFNNLLAPVRVRTQDRQRGGASRPQLEGGL